MAWDCSARAGISPPSAQFVPPCEATYSASSSRLHTPSLSNTPRNWFFTTCSVLPRQAAISGLVFPCHTMVATMISLRLNCSRGDMSELLLFKNCGGQNDAFAPLLDSRTQKQRAQVLLHGAWADVEFRRDFLIAAALHQQLQNVLIAARNLDLFQVQHAWLLYRSVCLMLPNHHQGKHVFRQSFAISPASPSACSCGTSGYAPPRGAPAKL